MVQAAYHFPRGFLWGTATAAHQVEGNNTNNQWWMWEQAGHTKGTSGLAADWWGGRWKEDLDRAAEGGQNAHRFSVEWSRIQPTPDTWDEDALERYRNLLRGMRDRGITPMVTLHHFSDRSWFYEMDAWENEQAPALFEKFVRKTVQALKEYCTLWCTINEPNVYALLGYVTGDFPTRHRGTNVAMQVMANMLRGHAAAYRAIHEIQPECARRLCPPAPAHGPQAIVESARPADAQHPLWRREHGFPVCHQHRRDENAHCESQHPRGQRDPGFSRPELLHCGNGQLPPWQARRAVHAQRLISRTQT